MESVNGLPAHPLFVHAPVVLVPLAALVAALVAVRPGHHRFDRWAVVAAATVALLATQLAVSSGYRLDEAAGGAIDASDHEALGETTRNLVALFLAVAVATAWSARRLGETSTPRRRMLDRGARVTCLAVATLATVWLVRTGHEGARLVWETVLVVSPP